jgi:hypothetical protein
VSDPASDTGPTGDELEQQRPVVPDDEPDLDGPLGDEQAAADEADLLEQHQPVPAEDEAEYYEEGTP